MVKVVDRGILHCDIENTEDIKESFIEYFENTEVKYNNKLRKIRDIPWKFSLENRSTKIEYIWGSTEMTDLM